MTDEEYLIARGWHRTLKDGHALWWHERLRHDVAGAIPLSPAEAVEAQLAEDRAVLTFVLARCLVRMVNHPEHIEVTLTPRGATMTDEEYLRACGWMERHGGWHPPREAPSGFDIYPAAVPVAEAVAAQVAEDRARAAFVAARTMAGEVTIPLRPEGGETIDITKLKDPR